MGSKDPRIGDVRVVDEKQIIAEEDLVIDAQFLIQEALMERGMTRSELAQQSGISKARLSQIMRADANPTLRTLAKLFYAMDDQLWLSRKDKMVADSENRCAWAEGNRSAPPAPSPKISKGIYQSIDCGTIRFSQASNDDTPQCVDSNGLETAA